jgi:aldehyde:ferredoxin oxidoreductase
MECYEKGLITQDDTGGLELRFGDAETVVKLVDMIGKREGIGDLLAEGSMRAAERIGKGASKYAINVKGLEVPAHEPRRKRGLAIGYAVSPTGADHEHNLHDSFTTTDQGIKNHKPFGIIEPVPLEDIGPRKVRLLLYTLNWKHMYNCLHMCMFVPWSPNELAQITKAVTGWETSVLELAKLGERAINLTRVFNVREGFSAKDDTLPDRFYSPQTSGPLSETALNKDELDQAVQIYYKMMGWDSEGVPSSEKLEELGIGWAHECI